ncbi:hypothetical protein PFISCL1PPCAC_17833, partial [Pristionchus fissidentatus]
HAIIILLQSFYFRLYIVPANLSQQVIPTRTATWLGSYFTLRKKQLRLSEWTCYTWMATSHFGLQYPDF